MRASRAFANEEADLAVVEDRASDLVRAIELTGELLAATPYAPGDRWPKGLRLDDDGVERIQERFEDRPPYTGDHEIPLAKVYRAALEHALDRARAERHGSPARYPSLLDAAASLAPGARGLRAAWMDLVRARRDAGAARREVDRVEWDMIDRGAELGAEPPELAAARAKLGEAEQALARAGSAVAEAAAAIRASGPARGEAQVVARDALEAASFALRLHIEALAVAPYVVKQAKRLARTEGRGGELVAPAEDARDLLDAERAAVEPLAEALAVAASTPLGATGGFLAHESALEQAARVNLDAVHLHAKGDVNLLAYHQLSSDGAHPGRSRRLETSVDPVLLLGGRVGVAYDFAHVKNAASLNAGFTTDRLFSSGGDIEAQSSLGELIGLDGAASDILDIGADLLGIHTSVTIATFTSGKVREIGVDPVTGRDTGVLGEAPFQLRYHQVDIGFDFTTLAPELAEDLWVESFLLGFRYMDYQLPRIVYELREEVPGAGENYVFNRQTPAQNVVSRIYMGGLVLRLGQGDWPRIAFYGDLGVYVGGGPGSYFFTPDPTAPEGPREAQDVTMLGLNGGATLGVRFRITTQRRPRLVADVSYHGDFVGQAAVTDIQETRREGTTTYTIGKTVDYGGWDVFHGPRLLLILAL